MGSHRDLLSMCICGPHFILICECVYMVLTLPCITKAVVCAICGMAHIKEP